MNICLSVVVPILIAIVFHAINMRIARTVSLINRYGKCTVESNVADIIKTVIVRNTDTSGAILAHFAKNTRRTTITGRLLIKLACLHKRQGFLAQIPY